MSTYLLIFYNVVKISLNLEKLRQPLVPVTSVDTYTQPTLQKLNPLDKYFTFDFVKTYKIPTYRKFYAH